MTQEDWEKIKKKKREQRMRKSLRRKWLCWILIVICVVVMIVCGCVLGRDLYQQYREEKEYQKIHLEAQKKPEEKPEDVQQKEELPKKIEIPIDFQVLWETNEDVYAWIEIPGTDIAYPVLQHPSDDSYYLDHTIDHDGGLPGSIYSESINKKDFSEFIHILYGHNMKMGTMFAQLHKFKEDTFFDENDTIIIYTPKHIYTYKIFAAIVNDDRHIMYSYDFATEEGKQSFLTDIYKNKDTRNQYRAGIAVTPEDQILVLSTCVGGESDRRYLVTGVLVDEK